MKYFPSLISAFVFLTTSAWASDYTTKVKTPRGSEMEVMVHKASILKGPAIVVAPGQSCNSKGPLFETIGSRGAEAGFTVVRFEWSYCLQNPSNPTPSGDLKNEIEDFNTALAYAKTLPSVDEKKILISGKSLGSMVAYSIFKSTPEAKALALLTPVCTYTTDEAGKPLSEPLKVCEENYPGLKLDLRSILMTMGDQDSMCLLGVLFDYLKDSKGNINVSVAGGDHGFRIKKADGSVDDIRSQRNIDSVVNHLLNWADLKMNE